MSIQFQFHPEKAIEATGTFLKLHGQPMNYLGLLKMLYMADRLALQRIEQPITGDHYVAMDYGPVLGGVYDLIKGQPVDQALPRWSDFICTQNNKFVSLINDPGNEDLCEEEEEIIQEVYKSFGHLDPFDVAGWTHTLPEWTNPHGCLIPISVEDVLRNIGKTNEEIQQIQREVIREAYLDRVLHDQHHY
ncbi:Panacea domain-containing protein [Thermosynechococcaceae cyanobacterium BACA0444]|uniref:Panacea domain-containing protein n=1 Tax=Pseudocalidococcus azoricus BACA0444 TaxID=2918990 RepID=A0AAE4FU24_9CYAN|nr:Panacea domain-containing protein [Pseudocalidococcus azoricus]MDS3861384.1 Panacea domain-containing protein [Pseudocalidococcus azoricus BACA0444]